MERRKKNPADPVIVAIHERLDKLEEIQASMHRIEEWIASVVRMNMIIEAFGDFIMRWSRRLIWIGGACVTAWVTLKFGVLEGLSFVRSFFK